MKTFEVMEQGTAEAIRVDGNEYLRLPAEMYTHGRGVWYTQGPMGFHYIGDLRSRSLEAAYMEQRKNGSVQ